MICIAKPTLWSLVMTLLKAKPRSAEWWEAIRALLTDGRIPNERVERLLDLQENQLLAKRK